MGNREGQKEERSANNERGTRHATNLNKGTINKKNDSRESGTTPRWLAALFLEQNKLH